MTKNRHISLQKAWNFRDMGGYIGADGKAIKWGLLYRSDELSKLTSEDICVVEKLGLKTIVDYRGDFERKNNEDKPITGAKVVYLDPKADVAAMASSEAKDHSEMFDTSKLTAAMAKGFMIAQNVEFVTNENSKQAFRQLLDLVLDKKNIPLVHHCRGGKDRTGFGALLILSLLGVSKQDILEDYMLTNFYKKEKNESSLQEMMEKTNNEDLVLAFRYMKEANLDYIYAALEEIEQKYGDVVQYCKQELNVTDAEIATLREFYLEEEK